MKRRSLLSLIASVPFLMAFKASAAVVKPERPAPRCILIPEVLFMDHEVLVSNNTRTIIYKKMCRWDLTTNDVIQTAMVDSPLYQSWLKEERPYKHGIPPHICFGGVVEVGKGGMNFNQWIKHTHQLLEEGKLK